MSCQVKYYSHTVNAEQGTCGIIALSPTSEYAELNFGSGCGKKFLRHRVFYRVSDKTSSVRLELRVDRRLPGKRKNHVARLNALSSAQGKRMMPKSEV